MLRRGFGRVGRPGLIGTAARTAVIAGTATAVSGGMMRHQQERAMEQQEAAAYQQQQQFAAQQQYAAQQAPPPPPPAPAPAAAAEDPIVAQLTQLADMKERGLLTDEEFQAQKARLLGS